jgi:hypothetical protein
MEGVIDMADAPLQLTAEDFDKGYGEIEDMPLGREKAVLILVSGLLIDGSHHKQWCIVQAIEALGLPLERARKMLPDYEFDEGIAP